jgi:hypothetical protein
MPPAVRALLDDLRRVNYPPTWRVSMRLLESVETYLSAVQAANFAEWRAAGEPEDWNQALWTTWMGREHHGVMLKGVEVYA